MHFTEQEKNQRFRQLYDRQFLRVYKLASLLLGNAWDAQDVTQQVFSKAWEQEKCFEDSGHETAWMITVTKNLCRDLQKSYYRKNRESLDAVPEPGISFETKEENSLWQALMLLPQKYRTVIYLYYYEGYSVKELSKMLHRRESTLQTQLSDGRKKLKRLLEVESV